MIYQTLSKLEVTYGHEIETQLPTVNTIGALAPSQTPKESVEKWRAKNIRTLLSLIIFRPTFFDHKHCSRFPTSFWGTLHFCPFGGHSTFVLLGDTPLLMLNRYSERLLPLSRFQSIRLDGIWEVS